MGTNFIKASTQLGLPGSTRAVTITTAAAQQVVMADSVTIQCVLYNSGPGAVAFGAVGVTLPTGSVLYPSASWIFEDVGEGFTFYARADSVASVLVVHEISPV